MRDTFVATLTELAAADSNLMLVTGDLGFGVLTAFAKRFPRQYLNVGVAEQNMTGVAAGLALSGKTVFTYSIANFPTLRCLEQVRNDVCYHDLPVIIVGIGGGFSYGPLGYSHHATEDLAIMRSLPGMSVIAPTCDEEVRVATKALVARKRPAYLRLDRESESVATHSNLEFGRVRSITPGGDVVLVATGGICGPVLAAARRLSELGVRVGVVAVSVLKPLDEVGLMAAIGAARLVVTVEEHSIIGGLGGAVAELISARGASAALLRLGVPDAWPQHVGSQDYLRAAVGIGVDQIVANVLSGLTEVPQETRAKLM